MERPTESEMEWYRMTRYHNLHLEGGGPSLQRAGEIHAWVKEHTQAKDSLPCTPKS